MKKYIPSLEWLRHYRKSWLSGDISAGLTVGVMLIPQGMAYSMLAGLPPIYGLYTVTLPLILYAMLGTSRQLAVGPVAMVSLLIFSGISQFAAPESENYIQMAILLALMVGIMQLSMGVLKLGFLVNFLSHPVISGFTSAAAVIIGTSQLKHLLGIKVEGERFIELVQQIFSKIHEFHNISLIIGIASISMLVAIRKWNKKFPGALIVVISGILAVYFNQWHLEGVKIVGKIPEGLPSFSLPQLNLDNLQNLLPTALTIALVGFMESIAVAKAMHLRHKSYHLDADQELRALGIANIAGAFFKSFPVTGGFSRTAVNNQAGAHTGLASLISASLIILTLLFFTPLFYYLPNAVLAAIILVAVYGLIDTHEFRHLWKTDKTDFTLFTIAAAGTLIMGIEEGIIIGVLLSIGLLVYRVSYPHFAELGYLKDYEEFRNISRFPNAVKEDEIVIFRFDAQLFFANANYFKDNLYHIIRHRRHPKFVIVQASGITSIDSSAVHMLDDLIKDLGEKGITLLFSDMIGPFRDKFIQSGLAHKIGKKHCFTNLHDAYEYAKGKGCAPDENIALQHFLD